MEPELSNPIPPEPIPPKKLNKALVGLITLIILVGVISWIMLFLQSKQVSQNIEVPTSEFSTWKTYKNEAYGFEFKYPEDWKYVTENGFPIFNLPDPECNCDASPSLFIYVFSSFTSLKSDYSKAKNFNEFLSEVFWISSSTKNIGGVIWNCGELEGPGSQNACFYQFPDGKIYKIFYSNHIPPVEDQILSTFKFTDSVDISNWKTYKNEAYGFEFKYPNDWYDFPLDSGSLYQFFVSNNQNFGKEEIGDDYLSDTASFGVQILKNTNPQNANKQNKNIQEWYSEKLKYTSEVVPGSEVLTTIGGRPAIRVEISGLRRSTNYFIWYGVDVISIYFPSSQPKFIETYNKVFSTFKFIEPELNGCFTGEDGKETCV